MVARSFVVPLALLIAGTPTVVAAQVSSSAHPLAIGESFPFSPTTSVRVLAIGEKSATALRGRERKSPVLLELEFDAGSKGEGVTLTPRTALVLRVGEQRFPVDHVAFHRLDQIPGWPGGPTDPPQVISVTDGLYTAFVIAGKARLGLLFDLPPEAAQSTKKLLEIAFSKGAQPTLISVDK
jgi:hypothetical protein